MSFQVTKIYISDIIIYMDYFIKLSEKFLSFYKEIIDA